MAGIGLCQNLRAVGGLCCDTCMLSARIYVCVCVSISIAVHTYVHICADGIRVLNQGPVPLELGHVARAILKDTLPKKYIAPVTYTYTVWKLQDSTVSSMSIPCTQLPARLLRNTFLASAVVGSAMNGQFHYEGPCLELKRSPGNPASKCSHPGVDRICSHTPYMPHILSASRWL